ncbi:YwmB family TATA-box binding protein [Paenibacillus arenilitoris]|uniref:YwmB family TATA-box binding protein n=1 Tax=Paenibacillus arenilitoris TaxID=2772299 RepID=A0A927CJG4_9BACL|nr:YwmB family TATA-box binding protein [Paenibacillus arenilitoris]MBD2867847.1 YwmB family TATA-box binding protein [Paenibacillus arenilitoris]
MYIPKGTMPGRKSPAGRRRAGRTRAGIALALLVIAAGAAWGLIEDGKEGGEATAAVQALRHDLQTLWEWGDGQFEGGSKAADWTIRWDVSGRSGTMAALAPKLFTDEKGESLDKLVQNEGKTVSGVVPAYGGRLSLSLVQEDEAGERLMLLLQTERTLLRDRSMLLESAASLSEELARGGGDFASSLKAQGKAESEDPVRQMMKLANAESVDRYEDGGTVSETFYTGKLRSGIEAGRGKTANLQVAAHRETETGKTALALGIPVITGDYGGMGEEGDSSMPRPE